MQVSNLATGPFDVKKLNVVDIPVTQPDPPVSSYRYLLAPQAIHLRLSAKCDSNCVYCERESWKKGDKEVEQDMPIEVWEKVRDEYMPHVNGIELAGLGEPMLAKTFTQVAREVLAANKILYFPTNGHFLNTKVADVLGDGANVRVSISMDAATPETYVSIGRGKVGDFEKTVKAVKAFKKKRPNAFLHSQFTAGTYNIDEFPAFIDLAHEMGIQEVTFRFVQAHTVAREEVSLRFHKDRTESALSAAWQKATDFGINLIAERRPYAEAVTTTPATSRLARYLDFVPMEAPNCSGETSESSCSVLNSTSLASGSCSSTTSVITITNTTTSVNLEPPGTNYFLYFGFGVTTEVVIVACTIKKWLCPGDSVTHSCAYGTAFLETIEVGSGLTYVTTTTGIDGTATTSTVGSVISGTSTTVIGSSWATSYGDCPPYYQSGQYTPLSVVDDQMSGDGTGVVSTVTVPRSELHAPVQQVQLTAAAAVVWDNGDITSCFARHVVGNAHTDDWDTLIRNPRYQAFLQRRKHGQVLSEPWCAGCPRVF